jgi:predicted dehydrogenase
MRATPLPSGATGLAHCNMAGQAHELTYRIVGSRGEAMAANFIQPHLDDRLLVRTGGGERVEHLANRSSYTFQLEAFTAAVRTGAPMPTDSDDAVATMQLIDRTYRAAGFEPRPRWVRPGSDARG